MSVASELRAAWQGRPVEVTRLAGAKAESPGLALALQAFVSIARTASGSGTTPRKIQPSKGLYYPNLEFKSTAWVKSALLYWDGLVRIRSSGTTPRDEPEIQELMAAGVIEEAWVEPMRRRLTPEFGRHVDKLVAAHDGRLPPGLPRMKPALGDTPELIRKVRQQVYDDLHDYPRARDALWNGDEDQARSLFWTFFFEKHANALGLAPATDEAIFQAIATFFAEEEITPDPSKLSHSDGSAIATLCLPTPSIEAISELPVDRLLEIRRKYAEQRHRFRERVQAQLAEIRELGTPQAIEERLKTLQREIEDDLDAAREAVKDSKAKERWTMLGITAPASIAAGITIGDAMLGVGTLTLGMTSWFMTRRAGSIPANHYLLSVDRTATDPWRRLGRAFRELFKE
jgi:hypothetical protein